ncbi:MAG TPA: CbiX/SirB N-terminal domain-containing protein [Chthonomonas sp.]|jgi:sirohydrochlorin ferrochelatase|uniref:sirohydrochlorin chelatase n=1 Tax=Chthonomonas sp. TaxID=2282153 RepID=UPI002B4AD186|nr:CbiX/SirB N-terminal domain-containing protein [Chthonomonas sp.]HLH80679.1 CbiX/SirB N-terminal domain-containing protein [Chthonomonas sp.]
MAKQALLVLVHGSPRPAANEAMYRVVDEVKRRGIFPIVEVGFLECNSPSIPEAIALCVQQGATEIVGVPYFLHTGTHVADDLPSLFEEAQKLYPEVHFRLGPYLGRSSQLTEVLVKRAVEAGNFE